MPHSPPSFDPTDFAFADDTVASELLPFVKRVIAALGRPNARFVSDESTVWDFLETGESEYFTRETPLRPWQKVPANPAVKAHNDAKLARASLQLGIPVDRHDRIVVLARALKNKADA